MAAYKGKCDETSPQRMEDKMFCDCIYGPGNNIHESNQIIEAKLREVEMEMKKLSNELSDAYYIALQHDMKQKTNYLRRTNFLLAFLRAENFDAPKATLRLAYFFKHKLETFGPELLARPICQADLNEDDRKVIESRYLHVGDEDCEGRLVGVICHSRLLESGLFNDRYAKNIKRAFFYQAMLLVETKHKFQKTDFVGIRWFCGHSFSLKDYHMTLYDSATMLYQALPLKVVAAHNCCDGVTTAALSASIDGVSKTQKSQYVSILHGPSPADCLLELSKYGIDIEALPFTMNGEFQVEKHQRLLEEIQRQESDPYPSIVKSEFENENNCIEKDVQSLESFHTMNPSLKIRSKNMQNEKIESLSFAGESIHKSIAMKTQSDVEDTSLQQKDIPLKNDESNEPVLLKLMRILDHDEAPDAIWWSHDGAAFTIDKCKFPKLVLKHKFDGIKMDSFLRGLRRKGCRRVPKTPLTPKNCVEYEHYLFQKNSPQLLNKWGTEPDDSGLSLSLQDQSLAVADNEDSLLQHVSLGQQATGCQYLEEDNPPLKLMNILESNTHSDAIWWTRGGTAFAINKKRFSTDILDKHLGGIKLDSFFRKLKRWGFHRFPSFIANPTSFTEFEHCLFQKGSPQLLKHWGKETKKIKFPARLMTLLESNKFPNAIWWVNGGRAFAIEKEQFRCDVLPNYFTGVKVKSFQRYLNRWGFTKVENSTINPNIVIFQHDLFQKKSPELMNKWNRPAKDPNK